MQPFLYDGMPYRTKKARTTGKVCTKKNTGSPLPQASADLPEQQIALDSIVPNDFNPRRNFSEQSLRELADNMTRVGLIHAVTLRSRSDGQEGYSLVCGERRFRAARLAGWETIRAKICPMSDAEAEDFAIAENLQWEDITPFEQGQAFKRLIDTRRYDVGTLALHFGRTRDFVLSRIRLLDLIPEVIELLNSEEINISQALELCRYEKEIQREVYDGYFKMGLDCHWRHLRAKELRSRLAGMYLSQLNSYRFDKTECASCASNRANQVLFADCGDCNVCQNRACMKRKNTEYLDRRSEKTAFGMSRHTDRLFRGLFAGRSPASPPGRIPPGPCAGLCRLLRGASRKTGGTAQGGFHRRGGLYGKHEYFPQRIGGVRTGVRRHTKTGRSGGTDTLCRDRRPRHRILLRRADSGNGRARMKVIRLGRPVRTIRRNFLETRSRRFPTSYRSPAKASIRKQAKYFHRKEKKYPIRKRSTGP